MTDDRLHIGRLRLEAPGLDRDAAARLGRLVAGKLSVDAPRIAAHGGNPGQNPIRVVAPDIRGTDLEGAATRIARAVREALT